MGVGRRLRQQATDDPRAVDVDKLRTGLEQASDAELRHATDAARKVAYSQPEAARRLRGELENVLTNPQYSGSIVSNARKALEYLPEERGTPARSCTDASAQDLRQLAMRRPESVDLDELALYLAAADRTEVRHATEAAKKVAYTRSSAPPLVEPLETIASGSAYASTVRESARAALEYLDEPGTTSRGTGRSSDRSTVVFDEDESEINGDRDDRDSREEPETVVFGGDGGPNGASDGNGSAVKFCPNCGTDLRRFDPVNFCSGCGTELS